MRKIGALIGTARIRTSHAALQQSTDIYCPSGLQQQTCSSGFAAAGSCWDRQTGRHLCGQCQ